jgi:hypothetical protein
VICPASDWSVAELGAEQSVRQDEDAGDTVCLPCIGAEAELQVAAWWMSPAHTLAFRPFRL